jgi:hypothetical protein
VRADCADLDAVDDGAEALVVEDGIVGKLGMQ